MSSVSRIDFKVSFIIVQSLGIFDLLNNLFSKTNQNFMRKIPDGTETTNVLVGEVDFLNYQFSTFVRLATPVILDDFTEVDVPTRFLFIILGPKGNSKRYREIGRSMATIMSDEVRYLEKG